MGETWYETELIKPELDDDLLMHYGVKGMRWRHKKGRKTYSKKGRRKSSLQYEPSEWEYDPSIPMVNENMRPPLERVYSKYVRKFNDSKFGKIWNAPITDTFKIGKEEAQASNSNRGDEYVTYYDSHGNLVRDKRIYYEGAKRRESNKRRTKRNYE